MCQRTADCLYDTLVSAGVQIQDAYATKPRPSAAATENLLDEADRDSENMDLTPSVGCLRLYNVKSVEWVRNSHRLTHAMARLSPYAWSWMFYHTMILFGVISVYFIFVFFFETSCIGGEQLPRVPFWVTAMFLPLLMILLPFEIRAMQRILPCRVKFAKGFPKGVRLWIWLLMGLAQGMIGRFDLATSLISVSRIWHSGSCNDIDKVWDEVRQTAMIALPPLWAAAIFAYGLSWIITLWTLIKILPAPACGRDWRPKSQEDDLPALKPFSISDLLFKYIHEPCSNIHGGFFSFTGGRVYVMNSLEQMAEITSARLVVAPLEDMEKQVEVEQTHKHPGTRRQMSQHILFDGLRSPCRFVFSAALWLNIKCSLIGIAGHLSGKSEVDGLLVLSVTMTTCSFAANLVLSMQSVRSRCRRLWPYMNKLHEGKWNEQTGDYVRDVHGNKMFEETTWQRKQNKCNVYFGLTMYWISVLVSVFMVAYAVLKLYSEIKKCNVGPWNWSGCVFPEDMIRTGNIHIKW